MPNCDLSQVVIQQIRRTPIHDVLVELGKAAAARHVLDKPEFKKLVAYILELADGRDRREPWTTRAGEARPTPRLRIAMEAAFGTFADLEWFKLNKTTNNAGLPLLGLFPRAAASMARIDCADFALIVRALCSEDPDAALQRLLQARSGKLKGVGVELFSRLASVFRRDLYFVIPKAWGERSGALKFIGGDLRRYCALCRGLRRVCDDLDIQRAIRASVLDRVIALPRPPAAVTAALNSVLGPSLARFAVLEPADAYEAGGEQDEIASRPLEFNARTIRCRRGEKRLRARLLRAYGNRCAITGDAPIDVLEVAYVMPFPEGNLHAVENAVLLRADLHTLWDLNLIAIDPDTMTVRTSPRLEGSLYETLGGRPLHPRSDSSRLSKAALRDRWTAFTATPKKTVAPNVKPSIVETPARRPAAAPVTAAPAPVAAAPPARPREDRRSASGSFMGIRGPKE